MVTASFFVAGIHLAVAVLTLVAGVVAWGVRRRAPIAVGFAGVCWTGTWWSLFDLLQIVVPTEDGRAGALYLWLVAPALLAIAFGALVRLLIDDRWRPGRPLVLGTAAYLAAVALAIVVPVTRGLTVESHWTTESGAFRWDPGPGFWGLIVVNALVFGALWLMLVHGMQHARPNQRRRLGLVLAATAFLALGGLATVIPLVRDQTGTNQMVDLTVLGFAAAAGLFLWWLASAGALMPGTGLRGLVVEGLDDAVLVVDRSGRVLDVNAAARRVVGPASAVGRPVAELLARVGPDVVPQTGRYRAGPDGSGEIDLTCTSLRANDEVVGTVVVVRDITEHVRDRDRVVASNRALREEIGSLRRTHQQAGVPGPVDDETGLPDRRALFEVLDAVVGDAERAAGVVRLDIDTMTLARRQVERGESGGTDLAATTVRAVAEALTACAPAGATVGRVSASGFAVVLPDADVESARRVVDDVRATLDGDGWPIGAGVAVVAAGEGVLGRRPPSYVLLARAEDALADSLARGRGQVVIDRRLR